MAKTDEARQTVIRKLATEHAAARADYDASTEEPEAVRSFLKGKAAGISIAMDYISCVLS